MYSQHNFRSIKSPPFLHLCTSLCLGSKKVCRNIDRGNGRGELGIVGAGVLKWQKENFLHQSKTDTVYLSFFPFPFSFLPSYLPSCHFLLLLRTSFPLFYLSLINFLCFSQYVLVLFCILYFLTFLLHMLSILSFCFQESRKVILFVVLLHKYTYCSPYFIDQRFYALIILVNS